jgi:hypothetical protein
MHTEIMKLIIGYYDNVMSTILCAVGLHIYCRHFADQQYCHGAAYCIQCIESNSGWLQKVFIQFVDKTGIISLNIIDQLIFVMEKCSVFFEVRAEFLNNI